LTKLKSIISRAVDKIEKYDKKDDRQIATVWNILREAKQRLNRDGESEK
jgi:hypothetical protein